MACCVAVSTVRDGIQNAAKLKTDSLRSTSRPHESDAIDLSELLSVCRTARALVSADGFSLRNNERTLVTVLRAPANHLIPQHRRHLPTQRLDCHSAHATLICCHSGRIPDRFAQAACRLPTQSDAFSPEQVSDALIAVGMPQLAQRLQRSALEPDLSLGEQQRLGWRGRCCTRRSICSSIGDRLAR